MSPLLVVFSLCSILAIYPSDAALQSSLNVATLTGWTKHDKNPTKNWVATTFKMVSNAANCGNVNPSCIRIIGLGVTSAEVKTPYDVYVSKTLDVTHWRNIDINFKIRTNSLDSAHGDEGFVEYKCDTDSTIRKTFHKGKGETKLWSGSFDLGTKQCNQLTLNIGGKLSGTADYVYINEVKMTYSTLSPTTRPTKTPTDNPTLNPSKDPTKSPSKQPSISPSQNPTGNPTKSPSTNPSFSPTKNPSKSPSKIPSSNPTVLPSISPSDNPTLQPSISPTDVMSIVYESNNYIGVPKLLNTDEAALFCEDNFNSNLATVLVEDDETEIETQILKAMYEDTRRSVVHFGYRDYNGIAKWLHGQCGATNIYNEIWHSTATSPHKMQCGYFNLLHPMHFDIGSCTLKRYFVCNHPNGKYSTPIC